MKLLKVAVALLMVFSIALPATSGKISGYVRDAESGEPLMGANVVIEGTILGAATNQEGYYVILNVPPGDFTVIANYIGYAPYQVKDLRVYIDLTTELNFPMRSQAIQTDAVMVIAEMPVVKKDVSGSQMNVNADEIEVLPATSVSEVLGMKAGITSSLGIRGSGADQVLFMVDGVTQRDNRNNTPIQSVPLSAVQEVSVQTGGMGAEYSNVRSGVVNVVAKEGPKDYYSATLSLRVSPPAYKNFGVSPYSPESYWLRPFLDDEACWFGIQSSGWDAYTIQQFEGNQFDGWNRVSAASVADADPDNDLTAAASQRVFEWQHRKDGYIHNPDYNIDLGFGGPVPLIGKGLGNLRFYASYFRNQNMYVIPLSTEGIYNTSGMLKLTSDISKKTKLSVTGNYSTVLGTSSGGTGFFSTSGGIASALDRRGFTVPWRIFTYEYFSQLKTVTNSLSAKVTHMIDAASFFEVTANRVQRNYYKGYGQLRDYSAIYEIFPGYFLDEAPVGWSYDYNNGIDGMALGGPFATARDSSKVVSYDVKANYRTQINQNNQIKAGLSFTYDDLYIFMRGINPLPDGQYLTEFTRKPYRFSGYLEDKLEFEGLITNLGIVADYINPNSEWYKPQGIYDGSFFGTFNPEWVNMDSVPAEYKEQAASQVCISPRVGISHPISETSKLYFNYGHYYQLPVAEDMYQIDFQTSTSQVNYFGNPSLKLARTISYEIGYDKSILNTYLVHLSAYYKDVSDQQDYTRYINSDGKVGYYLLTNNSFEDIRGFEVELNKQSGRWLAGNVNFEYRVNSYGYFGTKYYYENPTEQAAYEASNPVETKPLPQPRAKAFIDLHTPYDFGMALGGVKPLADWHFSLNSAWTSGAWFTWNPNIKETPSGGAIKYNVRWTDSYAFDLKISKSFELTRNIQVKLFADINNLFDRKQFSQEAFYDKYDYHDYMYSLHLPASQGDDLGYGNIPGSDKPGMMRADDVDFVSIVNLSSYSGTLQEGVLYYRAADGDYLSYNGSELVTAENSYVQDVLDNKAYINMPNLTSLIYLNPRDIYFGVNLSFDLGK